MSQPKQQQSPPGLQSEMDPVPDCGEDSYRGAGKLTGKAAVITGGDSGIGRAAAIAFAREVPDEPRVAAGHPGRRVGLHVPDRRRPIL